MQSFNLWCFDIAGPEYAIKYKTLIYLVGSASAEVIADIALCPFEAIKVRVQTQLGFARGLSDDLPNFVKSEGALGYVIFKTIWVWKKTIIFVNFLNFRLRLLSFYFFSYLFKLYKGLVPFGGRQIPCKLTFPVIPLKPKPWSVGWNSLSTMKSTIWNWLDNRKLLSFLFSDWDGFFPTVIWTFCNYTFLYIDIHTHTHRHVRTCTHIIFVSNRHGVGRVCNLTNNNMSIKNDAFSHCTFLIFSQHWTFYLHMISLCMLVLFVCRLCAHHVN